MSRGSFFLRFVIYPAIIALSVWIVIAKFVSLFFIPVWSPAISTVLLVLGAGAIGRLFYKNVRLIVAEVRQKAGGGVQILPPLHFLDRTKPVKPSHQFARGIAVVTLIVMALAGGWYAGKYNLLPFQTASQKSSACVTTQPPLPAVPNDVPNPSMEEVNSSNQPLVWQTEVTGHNDARFSTSPGHQSNHALTVTMKSYQDGSGMWFYPPQSAAQGQTYHYSDWYKATNTTSLILMYVAQGVTHYQVIDPNIPSSPKEWVHYSKSFDVPNQGGNLLPVSVIHALSSPGTLTIDDVMFHPEMSGFVRPLISFTFDDGWGSQYTDALPLLCKYKIPGTFYIISDYLTYQDYMNTNQIRSLLQDGEEIADHTVDHRNLARMTHNGVEWELSVSQQILQNTFGQRIDDFASPYGSVNEDVLQQVRGLFESHRGVVEGLNGPQDFDAYNIRCITVENTTSFAQIKQWIDQAIRTKTWLVLLFHQIDKSGLQYSATPSFLEQNLAYVTSQPIQPMTVKQALAEIYHQV